MTTATPPTMDIPMFNRSRYDEDRAYLATFITERIADIATERAALLAVERDLANLPQRTLVAADCPVCGAASIHDLRPLYALGRRLIHPFHGGWVIDPERDSGGTRMSMVSCYECATCRGFSVPVLPESERRVNWTPDSVSDHGTSMAAILMDTFPQIEEVVYRGTFSEWHVRVGLDLWWCYVGLKATILENLMLDRPRRKRRNYGARAKTTH